MTKYKLNHVDQYIEDLKCCGNCKSEDEKYCNTLRREIECFNVCPQWQYDELTATDREIDENQSSRN